MIRKLFSFFPLLLTLTMGAAIYFITNTAYPSQEWKQTSTISTKLLKNHGQESLDPINDKTLENLKSMISQHLKENAKPENQMRSYLFKVEQIKNQFTNKTDLNYNNNILTIHSHFLTDVVDHHFHESITRQIKMNLDSALADTIDSELTETDDLLKKAQIESYQLSEHSSSTESNETKEETQPSVEVAEVQTNIHIPNNIRNDLKMFKEYKNKKEARLKEIENTLKNMPQSASTPLIMVSSNLYNNYLNNRQILETKLVYAKDDDQLSANLKNELMTLEEKIELEEKKLRDESHFLKGERDKALRLQMQTLLIEQINIKETLVALNEFQKLIFLQDQPTKNSITKTDPKKEINNVSVKSNEDKLKEVNFEITRLNRVKNDLSTLKAKIKEKGLLQSDEDLEETNMNFYHDKFVLITSAVTLSLFWLMAGILFGQKPKVTKGERAANILKVPFLGEMPSIPNEGLENAKNKRLTDAIDSIAKKLIDIMTNQNIKSIGVVSLDSLDGRTQFTGMLSLSFNLNHEMKIIAMDTHFNNAKLKDFLELKTKMSPSDEGIISYLDQLDQTKEITEAENNQWLAKLVKPCIKNGIFVISPGKGKLEKPEIFNTKAIDTMNTGLAKYVDVIIYDTAPIHSDNSNLTKTLMSNSDGNILILKKGKNTIKELEALKKELQDTKLLGVVFKS